jgi:hypothetical protein
MEIYLNLADQECVVVTNQDGSTWSGLKSAYDEMITTQSTPIDTEDE